MKFTLVEAEIKQALKDYAAKLITVAPGATIDIEVKATRGADGVTAEIDVALPGAETAPVAPVQTARVAAPVAPVVVPEQPKAEVIGQTPPAPVEEPEPQLENDDDVPLEPVEPSVAGKSIFG